MTAKEQEQTRFLFYLTLCIVFPLPSLLALLILMIKKATRLNDTAFRAVSGLFSVLAVLFFLFNPAFLLEISIIPIIKIILGSSRLDPTGYFEPRMTISLLLSAPLCLVYQVVFDLLNGELKTPQIKAEKNTPTPYGGKTTKGDNLEKGVCLGFMGRSTNRAFYIPPGELIKHTALVGTTGSGKTTTIYNFVHYAMLKQQALIVIDGKGDLELAERIEQMSRAAERPFYFFSTHNPRTLGYNPLAIGNPTELTDKIISLTDWSEEHYKLSSQRYLQLLFRVFKIKNIPCDLVNVVRYSNRDQLEDLLMAELPAAGKTPATSPAIFEDIDLAAIGESEAAAEIPESPSIDLAEIQDLLVSIKSIDKKAVEGLFSRLGVLSEGDLGTLLKNRSTGVLELSEALDNRGVILFSFDSLTYPEQARLLGRLVVADIKSQISHHARHRPGERVSLIFDEFNVFVSHSVVDLVNKSRAAGFEGLLAFQSLADIDRLDKGKEIRRQIIQNCNTLIVQRQNDPTDAEEIANILGTRNSAKVTQQISTDGATGVGSFRTVKEYEFHPDDIKSLNTGEAIVKYHDKKGRKVKKIIVRQVV